MSAMGYREALRWIVMNDDVEFLDEPDDPPSVTLCFAADVFRRTVEIARSDLLAMRATLRRQGVIG